MRHNCCTRQRKSQARQCPLMVDTLPQRKHTFGNQNLVSRQAKSYFGYQNRSFLLSFPHSHVSTIVIHDILVRLQDNREPHTSAYCSHTRHLRLGTGQYARSCKPTHVITIGRQTFILVVCTKSSKQGFSNPADFACGVVQENPKRVFFTKEWLTAPLKNSGNWPIFGF